MGKEKLIPVTPITMARRKPPNWSELMDCSPSGIIDCTPLATGACRYSHHNTAATIPAPAAGARPMKGEAKRNTRYRTPNPSIATTGAQTDPPQSSQKHSAG